MTITSHMHDVAADSRPRMARPIHEHLNDRALQRFATCVVPEPNTGCWLWNSTVDGFGYGWFCLAGATFRTHRVALTIKLGRDVRGMALHSCDVPSCVNPDHLREGTHAENMRDRTARGRGRCGSGYKQPRISGSLHYKAKITEADVVEIRALAGTMTTADLGRRYGIAKQTVSRIVRRERWTHV